jgi:hypothetical protein
VRTTDWRSPALLIFRRRLSVVSLMTSPWPPPSAPVGRLDGMLRLRHVVERDTVEEFRRQRE